MALPIPKGWKAFVGPRRAPEKIPALFGIEPGTESGLIFPTLIIAHNAVIISGLGVEPREEDDRLRRK